MYYTSGVFYFIIIRSGSYSGLILFCSSGGRGLKKYFIVYCGIKIILYLCININKTTMDDRKNLFQNNYVEFFFYFRGILCGLISEGGDIHLVLPFFGITFKKEHNNFIKNYGEFIMGVTVGWFVLIIISHFIL